MAFHAGDQGLGHVRVLRESLKPPFSRTWTPSFPGAYVITVVAYDDDFAAAKATIRVDVR